MAALTDNRLRSSVYNLRSTTNKDVNASTTVYEGAIVYNDAATGRVTLVTNAGANKILGISRDFYLSTPSASTGRPLKIDFHHLEELTLAGVTEADIGKVVYATTDNDITLTSTNASRLGILHSIVSGTNVRVEIVPNP